jgi:hypothetical protein
MNHNESAPVLAPPSLPQLVRTTLIAVVVAALLLITTVLPAEYAIDPLGTGRMLGLTDIATPQVEVVEDVPAAGAPLLPTVRGPLGLYPAGFKVDVFEVTLQPYDYIEYKYRLEAGAAFMYSWKASAPLLQDFHGERATTPDGSPAEESFDKNDRQEAHGTLTAPFAGIHGWYWENPGGTAVTIRLSSAGFFASAVEIHSDRTRHPRTLRSLDDTMDSIGNSNAPK